MSGRLHLQRLPEPYRQPAGQICRRLMSAYPNTAALIVIGSVARGTWQPDSDLDLAWIHRGRRPRQWRDHVFEWCVDPVELVPLNLTQVRRHVLAHALQHGIPVYDCEGLHCRLQQVILGLPSRQWIDQIYDFMWYRFEWGMDSYHRERDFHRRQRHTTDDCFCRASEILTRATLNLIRVLLVLHGHVPLCKAHTRELYPSAIRGRRLRQAMEITLQAHHERRDLTLPEAREVAYLGRWTKEKLVATLGVPASGTRAAQVRRLRTAEQARTTEEA